MLSSINSKKPLFSFYKEEEKFFFLIKKPFTKSKLRISNFIQYKYFNMEEIKDNGLLIGYCFDFKNEQPIWSEKFIGLFKEQYKVKNYNILYMNKYLAIIEDSKANNLLIIGAKNDKSSF